MDEMTRVYLMLGTAGSGRREILADLIGGSFECSHGKTIVLINDKEEKCSADEKLKKLSNTSVLEWNFNNSRLNLPDFEASKDDTIFLVLSSKENLVEQIEEIKNWLDTHSEVELARVLSVIDCQLVFKKEALLPWFEAVIYFSDYVLLTHREDIPEKWLSDFIKSFEKQSYPCLFEKVKKDGTVANPDHVLEPEARRISHVFDNLDAVDTLELDEENLPEGPFELKKKVDPYLERDNEGRRIIHLPLPNTN